MNVSAKAATFHDHGRYLHPSLPFCDVGHGRPNPLDADEPRHLGETIAALKLKYVVITSVDRDDLRDGGAQHFVDCIQASRELSPATQIEVLVPDFRGRLEVALQTFVNGLPDVNEPQSGNRATPLQSRPPRCRLRPLAAAAARFRATLPVGTDQIRHHGRPGETDEEILRKTMRDMRDHNIDMITIGQYLQPSNGHLPVQRYVHPDTFKMFREQGLRNGLQTRCGRCNGASSYHADPTGTWRGHPRLDLTQNRQALE